MMPARKNITDRAHRYRAQKNAPDGPRVCAYCGSRRFITVDHVDGFPDHTEPDNLQYLCKSCNTAKGVAFRDAGRGRPTNQYNPTKSGGAANVGEWAQALGAIIPHKGEKYAGYRYGLTSSMSTADAVAMIRATPAAKRREYAAKINQHKRGRARAAADERWNPADNPLFVKSKHYTRKPGGVFQDVSRYESVTAAKRGSLGRSKQARRALELESQFERAGRKKVDKRRVVTDESVIAELMRNPGASYRGRSVAELERIRPHVAVLTVDDDWLVRDRGRRELEKVDHALKLARKREAKRGNAGSSFRSSRGLGVREGRKLRGASAEKLDKLADEWIKKTAYIGASIPYERDQYRAGLQDAVDAYRAAAKRNPADAAAEVYEEFHGHPSQELVTVTQKVHRHTHLAAAGELRALVVKGVDKQIHTIKGFGGALLAFNEAKNQLFVRGGDQSLNLGDFGIKKPHELETLGRVKEIDYHTDKSHLGDEGGRATYNHRFRTTNENGQHVTVEIARYPDLIYRVLDEQFEFSGGSYLIRAEGIDV